MHHWADVSDMLSTFFFGRTTKPLVFSFYCPQQVTVCRLWFLLFVFPFFCVFSFYFCLGISWLLGSRSKLICNDTLSAAVPRGFPALENRRRSFQPFPTQLSLGLLVYLVDEFVRIIAGFAFPHSRHVIQRPETLTRGLFFWGVFDF